MSAIGLYSLLFAFGISILQIFIPLMGVLKNNLALMKASKFFAVTQFIFIAYAFFILMHAFLVNDFSNIYVAQNSNTYLPTIYKLCALWSAHTGSLLLWILILSLWSAAVALFSRLLPLSVSARILIVMGIISAAFYAFLFYHANPFATQFPAPKQGGDLNPILQDVGLEIHPPLLYVGYIGFSVVFAFGIAALWCKEFNMHWAGWMKPWARIAWCFLTLGIVLGSWWSYRELGWGGFWFWDPVENASLMPWLAGTALLHILVIAERKNNFHAWTIFLSLCVFALSLLGTFLVRSGILISVHTFSEDPTRGLFLLRMIMVIIGCALFLFAWRAKYFMHPEKIYLRSRDSLILANNALLFVSMLIILMGTLYPLVIEVFGLGRVSVGAPYFNTVLLPILIATLFFLIFTIRIKNAGMIVAHLGMAITAFGIIFSGIGSLEKQAVMKVGSVENIGEYHVVLKKIIQVKASDYVAFQATMLIEKKNKLIAIVHPQLREFFISRILLPKAGISAGIFRDFYIALGMPQPDDEWMVRIDVKPFVRWVWAGGLLMVLGGFLALLKKRSGSIRAL